jgi:hypothetical protein
MRESTDRNDQEHDLGAVVSLFEILADLDRVDEETMPLPEGGLAQAQAAAAQLFTGVGQLTPAAANPVIATPAAVAMTLTAIEEWLSTTNLEAATVRGAVAASTVDGHEPGLVAYIEIDADIDTETGTAKITVVVEAVENRGAPLELSVRNAAGVTRTGVVNSYGVVVIEDMPITEHSPNDLRFEWSSPRRTP